MRPYQSLRVRLLLSGVAICAAAGIALADSDLQSNQLEEIVVTAEKRQESLHDVPISVVAATGEQLAAAGIQDALDLPQIAAGLITINGPNASDFQTPYIRGVGSSSTLNGVDASVATYVDGVYQPFKNTNLLDLQGIDHIEVLKGPQGTLFGRNATGGAINVLTKDPSNTFSTTGEISYGRFDQTQEYGYINLPINSVLAVNTSISAHQGGDFYRNEFTGQSQGSTNSITVTSKILLQPSDPLRIVFGMIYQDRYTTAQSANMTMVPGSIPVGTLFGGTASFTDYVSANNFPDREEVHQAEASLHVKYSFDGIDLVSISSAQFAGTHTQLDYDGTSAAVFAFDEVDHSTTYTQELQLLSTWKSPLQWILGAYYIFDKEPYDPLDLVTTGPPAGVYVTPKTNAGAVFGDLIYDFGEGNKLTGGLRYSVERREMDGTESVGGIVIAGPVNLEHTFDKPTWRAIFEHAFTNDVMAYASYNRGFKSGAYNSTSVVNQAPIAPEVLDAYEIGLKALTLNHQLEFNGATYFYNYSNIQVQRVDPSVSSAAILEAAGKARLYGFDGDLVYLPMRGLRLRAGMNLEHSQYTQYDNASGYAYIGGFGVSTTYNAKGQQLLYAPNLTFNLGADYNYYLGNGSRVELDSNYGYTGHYNEVIGDGNYSSAYGTLNASLSWHAPSDKFYVRAWGRNLTDNHDIGRLLNSLSYQKQLALPITYGVAFGASF